MIVAPHKPRIVERSDVIGPQCGILNTRGIRVVCQWFYDCVQSGEMSLDRKRGGWTWSELPLREVSFGAKWAAYQQDRDIEDHTGEPYLLADTCPGCGGQLPLVAMRDDSE